MANPILPFTAVNTQERVQAEVTRLQGNFDRIQAQLEGYRTSFNTLNGEVLALENGGSDIIAAGTAAFPDSISYNSQGRITAITAGQAKLLASSRGVANGVARLDASGRIPISELPTGVFEFRGTWNASTNTPLLTSGGGTAGGPFSSGDAYIVSAAGSTNLDDITGWQIGDIAVFGPNNRWARIPTSQVASVASVNGLTGAVTLGIANIGPFTIAQLNAALSDATLDNNTSPRPPTGSIVQGDLRGTYAVPTVTGIRGREIVATVPTDGQVLRYDQSNNNWAPGNAVTQLDTLTGSITRAQLNGLVDDRILEVTITVATVLSDTTHNDRLLRTSANLTFNNVLPDGFNCYVQNANAAGGNDVELVGDGVSFRGSTTVRPGEAVLCTKSGTIVDIVAFATGGSSTTVRTGAFPPVTFNAVTSDQSPGAGDTGEGYVFTGATGRAFNLPDTRLLTVGDFYTVINDLDNVLTVLVEPFIVGVIGTPDDRIAGLGPATADIVSAGESATYVYRGSNLWQKIADAQENVIPLFPESDLSPVVEGSNDPTAVDVDITPAIYSASGENRTFQGVGVIQIPSVLSPSVPVGSGMRFITTGTTVSPLRVLPAAGQNFDNGGTLLITSGNRLSLGATANPTDRELIIYKKDLVSTNWSVFYYGPSRGVSRVAANTPTGVTSWLGLGGIINRAEARTAIDLLGYPRAADEDTATIWEGVLDGSTSTPNATAAGAAISGARVNIESFGTSLEVVYQPGVQLNFSALNVAPFTVPANVGEVLLVALPSSFTGDNFAVVINDENGVEVEGTRFTGVGTGPRQFRAVAGTVTDGARAWIANSSAQLRTGWTVNVVETAAGFDYALPPGTKVGRAALPDISVRELDAELRGRLLFDGLSDAMDRLEDVLTTVVGTATEPEAQQNFPIAYFPTALGITDVPFADLADYPRANGWDPFVNTRIFVLLPEYTVSATAFFNDNTTVAMTLIGRRRFLDTAGQPTTFVAFYFDVGASITTAQDNGPGTIQASTNVPTNVRASDVLEIRQGNLSQSLLERINHPGTAISDAVQAFHRDLSRTTRTATWQTVSPAPYAFGLTRVIAALWDENRNTVNGNYFDDIVDTTVEIASTAIAYYTPTANNLLWPGQRSFAEDRPVTVRNTTASATSPINPTNYNLVLAFQFRIDAVSLSAVPANERLLRFGNTAEPVLTLDQTNGLAYREGGQDGSTVNRTVTTALQVENPNWSTRPAQSTNEQSEIVLATRQGGSGDLVSGFTFPLTVTINVQRWNNDNDEGSVSQTYVITAENADQGTPTALAFNHGVSPDPTLTINATYDAGNTDVAGVTRNIVLLTSSAALTNSAIHYTITASISRTESITIPSTYNTRSIDAGDPHDSNGFFDPSRYNTRQRGITNDVILAFRKFDETDQSADPELAMAVVVDGEFEDPFGNLGPGFVRLHRRASDLGFVNGQINDQGIQVGNDHVQTARIQSYYWSGTRAPNRAEMLNLWQRRNQWFGAFRNSREITDVFTLQGNLAIVDDTNTIDIGAKLIQSTVQRVTLSSSDSSNTAGQSFTFANNPATSLPWNTTDFDEIFVEHVVSGSIFSGYIRANVANGYSVGGTTGVDLNATSIDFNDAGSSHRVIGVRYT